MCGINLMVLGHLLVEMVLKYQSIKYVVAEFDCVYKFVYIFVLHLHIPSKQQR